MINEHAAGIDIGSDRHWVCVPFGSCAEKDRVRRFGAFTKDLYAIRDWLKQCGVTTVAMESTGVYWVPLYQVLEAAGFELYLVNTRQYKGVPGRPKDDPADCQWLQRLHSYGLLRRSFRPCGDICALRELWRYRDVLIKDYSRTVQHIQKALQQMNVLLHQVVDDITGKTGMAVLGAMVNGERDPAQLLRFRDSRVKAKPEEFVEALRGDYREEQILIISMLLGKLAMYRSQIARIDNNINERLVQIEPNASDIPEQQLLTTALRRNTHTHAPRFDAVHMVQRLYGTTVGDIPGFGGTILMGVLSEVGLDLSRWKNAKHFCSWLTLSPVARISGGKPLGRFATARTGNRAGRYFRQAASTLKHNDSPLGHFFRRMRARKGTKHAIVCTAHKLATIFYTMVTEGKPYDYPDPGDYHTKVREAQLRRLHRHAAKLGMKVVANDANTESAA